MDTLGPVTWSAHQSTINRRVDEFDRKAGDGMLLAPTVDRDGRACGVVETADGRFVIVPFDAMHRAEPAA
jgi:hypothetical protein